MDKGKFVYIVIDDNQLPVFLHVKSKKFKDLYYCILKSKDKGLHIKKADREFREKREKYLMECYDGFCTA